ncbi:MAG TPA: hypothetical protein VGO25_05495 [Rhodanobacteraceae bacterium]|nr:hypothetical protein [Rhodanobacteraceae bacterium]
MGAGLAQWSVESGKNCLSRNRLLEEFVEAGFRGVLERVLSLKASQRYEASATVRIAISNSPRCLETI